VLIGQTWRNESRSDPVRQEAASPLPWTVDMHVLLASFDLFKEVGGGQTFYRNLIRRNPQIQFTYLVASESVNARRPENAKVVPCTDRDVRHPISCFADLETPRWLDASFVRAEDVAQAVAGRHFDVVDLPDYEQFGFFLRDAFDHHQVSVDRVVLGMHGRYSTSVSLNWCVEERGCIELAQQETMQYQTVDARYFISAKYRDEWRAIDPVPAHVLDPLWFFEVPRLQPYQDRLGPPDLNFVGRSEKLKGPDIFIQLAWWLPRSCYRAAHVIGPQSFDGNRTPSDAYVRQMIKNRRLTGVDVVRCMTAAELTQLYATKSVTVLPSVYDTLNLVALESLLSGCPTAVGSGAGVCRYLRERFPDVPFEVIDVVNWYESVPRLESMLRNYQDYRRRLRDAIAGQDLQPRGATLIDAYQAPPAYDPVLRARVTDWYERLSRRAATAHRGLERHASCA
jgi:glycosyltransferase involved in cell wall biosynthesis